MSPSAEEDVEIVYGGSDGELTDVEDVFVSEEAEVSNRICCDSRQRRWSYAIKPASLTAAGAPTAKGGRPGGGASGKGKME